MFYLSLAALVWVASIWVVRWDRIRELFVYGLMGALIAGVEDRVGRLFGFWHYLDYGPIRNHDAIIVIIVLSAVPLFAMAFVQGLRPGAPIPWLRVGLYTAVSLLPEILALRTGHMIHGNGWSMFWSVVAYPPTWIGLWALHRWLTSQAPDQRIAPPTKHEPPSM